LKAANLGNDADMTAAICGQGPAPSTANPASRRRGFRN